MVVPMLTPCVGNKPKETVSENTVGETKDSLLGLATQEENMNLLVFGAQQKIESNLQNSGSTCSGQSMVDLTNTQDYRTSEKIPVSKLSVSLIRSFSKYTPNSKASNTSENLSNLPCVKVEEPSKISGTDPNRTLEEEMQLNNVQTEPKSGSKEHEA